MTQILDEKQEIRDGNRKGRRATIRPVIRLVLDETEGDCTNARVVRYRNTALFEDLERLYERHEFLEAEITSIKIAQAS